MNLVKSINKLLYAVFFALLVSVLFEVMVPGAGVWVLLALLIVSFAAPIFKKPGAAANRLCALIYREAWDKELIKRFNTADEGSWRDGVKDIGKYFNMLQDNEVVMVNLTYFGVSPDILINNTTYPLTVQPLDGEPLVVSVNKFQSRPTPVSDDEMYGLNYDKMAAVQESHSTKMIEEKNNKGIHSVGPAGDTADTPVLVTTGDLVDGRRMLIKKDLITFRKKLDKLKHPGKGRRLVFCTDHENDMLLQDEKFAEQYYMAETGKPLNRWGFEFYKSTTNPFYNATTKAKLSFGGIVTGAHTEASVYFHVSRVVQGKGFTKNYLTPAVQDALNQRNLYAIRHYDIVTPYKNEGIGAIVSATA